MIVLLSPSKGMNTRDFDKNGWVQTQPSHIDLSAVIVNYFKKWNDEKFKTEMKLSEKLAGETKLHYQNWEKKPASAALQSIFAYQGDVYGGLDARKFNLDELNYANNHLRIISGLYGLLKPSDIIMEYRLEIGFSREIEGIGRLYNLWKPLITKQLFDDLEKSNEKVIIDLTSKEYSRTIDFKSLSGSKRIEFEFYENKNGKLVFASFNSKRARGLMANYIIRNKISDIESLKNFSFESYKFSKKDSTESKLVFIR
jgi:cytoplasmic iron level regulating protein YaaA (DUF328/UPF0246 family)